MRNDVLRRSMTCLEDMPMGPSPVPLQEGQVDHRFLLKPHRRRVGENLFPSANPTVQLRLFGYDEGHKYRVPIPNLSEEDSGSFGANPEAEAELEYRRDQLPRIEAIFRMRNTIVRVVDPHGYEIIRRHGGYFSNKPGSTGIRQKIEYSTGMQLTLKVISEARGRYPGLKNVHVSTRGYSAARTGFIEGICMSGLHVHTLSDATLLYKNPFRPRPPVHIRYKVGGHYFSAWKRHRQTIGYQISRFALFATPLTG